MEYVCWSACQRPLGSAARGSGAAEREAGAGLVVDQEQQARLRSDGDLGVVTGGFERLAALD